MAPVRGKVAVVAVVYHEPTWFKTAESIAACCVPVFLASRGGLHGLPRAFNTALEVHGLASKFEYLWCVTDVVFQWDVLPKLVAAMDSLPDYAAITPAFASDHAHTRPNGNFHVEEAPFVEFTAPLVRSDVLAALPLDEEMPYDGHDLDWGYRVRRAGHKIGVHHGVRVDHTYLRRLAKHGVTRERSRLRRQEHDKTFGILEERYGPEWRRLLGFG